MAEELVAYLALWLKPSAAACGDPQPFAATVLSAAVGKALKSPPASASTYGLWAELLEHKSPQQVHLLANLTMHAKVGMTAHMVGHVRAVGVDGSEVAKTVPTLFVKYGLQRK